MSLAPPPPTWIHLRVGTPLRILDLPYFLIEIAKLVLNKTNNNFTDVLKYISKWIYFHLNMYFLSLEFNIITFTHVKAIKGIF